MKHILLIFIFFIFLNSSYCQLKKISVLKIANQQVKSIQCLDSTGIISKFCSLDLDGFSIIFYSAYLDKSKNELQLIGRVCSSDKMNSSGIAGVQIFKALKKDNKLTKRYSIGETTYDKNSINNDGFFDITLKVEKKNSLFFYNQKYFLKEFTISRLLQ